MRTPGPAVLVALSGMATGASSAHAQTTPLEGAWVPMDYVMTDGTRHDVDGRIFFAGSDWSVLFFVMEDGAVRRGSAEGGTFEATGDSLVFTHLYHLSAGEAVAGLPESPLRMDVVATSAAVREPCRFEIREDRLTIYFPSGNRMVFGKSSAP